MDFSLTTVFVNPVGGTLATAGATSALTPGKIGLFKKTYAAPAVAGTDTRFVIAQGRNVDEVPQTTKKSDVIDLSRIIRYKQFAPVTTAVTKVVEVKGFTAKCGEQVTITLRGFSKYLNVSYVNGYTKSFTLNTPCCECGEDPCTVVDAEALVDQFVALINASDYGAYVTASKAADGDSFKLVLTANAITQDTPGVMLDNFIYNGYDYLEFYAYAYKGVDTSVEDVVANRCDVFATVTTTRRPTQTRGSSAEVSLIEQRHYAYQSGKMKDLNCNPDMNPLFTSNVAPNTWYSEFLIKFRPLEGNQTWNMSQEIDQTVRIFVAQAQAAAFKTALDAMIRAADIENEY